MSLDIEPIHRERPDFAGRVSGIDIARGVSDREAADIEKGMDRYAVLVIPGQRLDDEQQYRFSTHFGPMETATGDISAPEDRRLSMDVNDISNLDRDGQVLARDDRRLARVVFSVDDVPVGSLTAPPFALDAVVPLQTVEAIEVYRTASQAPLQYGGTLGGCGVLVIWTKAR